MSDSAGPKVANRWLVVVGAVIIQLCLGAIYAWSVFTPYLIEAPFSFSKTQTQVIFSVSLAAFAITMILAGRWQARSGPRIVALTGGLVLGAGYILAGLLKDALFGHFVNQVLFVGLVAGIGIGLAYVCPIAVGMRWFPDKKGLITGLAVAGFGFGALIWMQLAGGFGGLLESLGVSGVFTLYGVIFAVAVTIGSTWMVNPPAGWRPEGWTPTVSTTSDSCPPAVSMTAGQMLRTPQFFGIWVMFIFSAMAGLLVIGNIKLFGIEALQTGGRSAEEASVIAGIAMSVFYSLANGGGRIAWGSISDRIGRQRSLTIMCLIQGVIMILFYWMGSSPALLYLGTTIIGFNFGGNFALFPTETGDLFGVEHVGECYGWVFTAYGVGGIIGPIMAASFREAFQSWMAGFIVAGVACLIAAFIATRLRQPRVEGEPA
ncbi:MAG: OFA family MFS transporter [Anaerolineae bacterium]